MQNDRPVDMKIVVNGPSHAGKTTLCHRLSRDEFVTDIQTIGIEFYVKELQHQTRRLRMVMWDVAGAKRHNVIQQRLYRDTDAVLLCFDVSNAAELEKLREYFAEVARYAPSCPIVMIGCKTDLSQQVTEQDVIDLAKQYPQTSQVIMTSAKSGDGTAKLLEYLTSRLSGTAFERDAKKAPTVPQQRSICGMI